MRKVYISELDVKVNKNNTISLSTAMQRIYKHITSEIDQSLPKEEFTQWYEAGADKPLRWNAVNYYWSK